MSPQPAGNVIRSLIAALTLSVPTWTACRDAPVSPPSIVDVRSPVLAISSTAEDIALLRSLVAALETDGTLNAGQANALTSKIDAAARRLEADRGKAATNVFGAFVNQVHAFVNARVLTAGQAQPLLDAVLSLTGSGVPRKALAAGYRFTCALNDTGAAQCWGLNEYGQLGDGTTQTRLAPVRVLGEHTFRQITAGSDFACALTGDGVVYCWGANASGQLGDGSNTDRKSPGAVATTLRFVQITAGAYHACALTSSGSAYCWGRNDAGPVGDGSWTNRNVPTPVAGGLSFTEVRAGGFHTCGTTASGSYCWGWNAFAQLGDGTLTSRNVPTPIAGGTNFRTIAPYAYHTCALTDAGRAYCWGDYGGGALGDDMMVPHYVPAPVAGGLTFGTLSDGGVLGSFTCGVTTAGPTYCWGVNNYGQVGDGTNIERRTPTLVAGGHAFTRLTGGGEHNCGRTGAGAIYCWGGNFAGQLGDGTTISRNTPTPVAGGG